MTPTSLKRYFDPAQPLPLGEQWKPGVFLKLPEAEYRAFPGLNASLLKNPTAAEMWHSMTAPPEDKWGTESECAKWTVGTLVHWAVLEPWRFADFDQHIAISPTKGLATDRAKRVREAYPDKLVVSPEHIELALKCRQALEMNDVVRLMLEPPGGREVSLFCWDKSLESWRKARFDFIPFESDYLLDVKTTAFPPPQFPKEARKLGYHFQAQWYLDTWEMLTGERRRWFRWVVVNKSEPFMSQVWEVENVPRGHVARQRSPLGAADEIVGKRAAVWAASAWDMINRAKYTATFSPSLIRACWAAYENDPIQLLSFN